MPSSGDEFRDVRMTATNNGRRCSSMIERRQSICIAEAERRRMSLPAYQRWLLEEHPQSEDSRTPLRQPGTGASHYCNQVKDSKIEGLPQLWNEFHRIMAEFTESRTFAAFILVIILINTGMLIAQTWQIVAIRGGWYFSAIDSVFLGIYIMEMVLKIYVYRIKFFKEGWNILDLSIVVANLFDFFLPLIIQNVRGFNSAAVFRLLRIFRAVRAIRALRVLRTIRFLTNLQVIVITLMQSIRSIGAIVILTTLFLYMFAMVGRGLYAKEDPEHFGTIFSAFVTLFQLLTLDDWFEIYQKVSSKGRRDIGVYLFLYMVAEYFVFLNLFVAVLVDNFQLTLEAQNEADKKKRLENQQEEDDEEDYFLSVAGEEVDWTVQEKRRKTIRDYFPEASSSDQNDVSRYYQLVAALEEASHAKHSQQTLLNVFVDMTSEKNDHLS